MHYYILKPSTILQLLSLVLNLTLVIVVILSPIELWLKIFLLGFVYLIFYFEWRKINHKNVNSILALRKHNQSWQIKLKNSWQDGQIVKASFLADILVFILIKTKNKKHHIAVARDSLETEAFRQLRVSLKTLC